MVWSIALGLVALYVAYCGFLFLTQRSMLFPGAGSRVDAAAEPRPVPAETISLLTSFGTVEAWYYAPQPNSESGPQPAVIIAHGNAELIDNFPVDFLRFTELGLAVLAVEYPGYGRSQGSPSQETISEALVVAYDWLVARQDIDGERIILFGRSLGGGAVCTLAAQRPSAALILLSTFTGIRELARRYMAPAVLVRDPFDNLDVVSHYNNPVLVMHGTTDELIPHSHGQRLSAAARRGRLVDLECGHNDCPRHWDSFWRDIAGFLAAETDVTK
jgi:fermentation-respiration switch protein FrsA (DUF1100 family)